MKEMSDWAGKSDSAENSAGQQKSDWIKLRLGRKVRFYCVCVGMCACVCACVCCTFVLLCMCACRKHTIGTPRQPESAKPRLRYYGDCRQGPVETVRVPIETVRVPIETVMVQ